MTLPPEEIERFDSRNRTRPPRKKRRRRTTLVSIMRDLRKAGIDRYKIEADGAVTVGIDKPAQNLGSGPVTKPGENLGSSRQVFDAADAIGDMDRWN